MLNRAEIGQRLDEAAAAGLLAPEQIAPLNEFLTRDFAAPQSAVTATIPGEEDLRFVRNFHDVFLATGIVLLAIGLAITVGVIVEKAQGAEIMVALTALLGSAGVMWALGEVFSRRRRLFMPSIAICISFTLFCVFAGLAGYAQFIGGGAKAFNFDFSEESAMLARAAAPVSAVTGLLACAAFYARFRLPFSMGLLGALGVLSLVATIFWTSPHVLKAASALVILGGGLAMFAAGIWFDARDPQRATRISDNGFWLHMGAAPLILHGVLSLVGGGVGPIAGQGGEEGNLVAAIVTLMVIAVLGLTSLLINRRALIVSALITTGIAVGAIMKAVGIEAGGLAAITLVTLGGGVLILGAGWHSARRALLKHAPQTGVWARIFPPETSLESAPRSVATA